MQACSSLKKWPATALLAGVVMLALIAGPARAGDADPANKQAWAENAGWLNFGPTHGPGLVTDYTHLSGYVWAENIGWIKLGNDAGGPYQNTSSSDWGVNLTGDNKLRGYAWSENAGWIRFDPTHSQATVDRNTGVFDGYAWSENIGYIHFKNTSPAYNVRTTKGLVMGTLIMVR